MSCHASFTFVSPASLPLLIRRTNQDFVIGSLMRNNLEKLSPTTTTTTNKPPAPRFPSAVTAAMATMPRHRPPPAPIAAAEGTAGNSSWSHAGQHAGNSNWSHAGNNRGGGPPMLSRTNSVGRLVSNFEHSSGSNGGGLNSSANRFLLERQRSSPSLPHAAANCLPGNGNGGNFQNGFQTGRITKPTWKPPVPSALSKPVQLKTRFRLGDGDVEIDPSVSNPPGRNRDFGGPTSLVKPPVPTTGKPTLRHTVRSAPKS